MSHQFTCDDGRLGIDDRILGEFNVCIISLVMEKNINEANMTYHPPDIDQAGTPPHSISFFRRSRCRRKRSWMRQPLSSSLITAVEHKGDFGISHGGRLC